MKHLGDISKINGAHIEPVDLITFGSPCQDLSVAGKRAGMKHEANGDQETTRSGLFMEAVRIIKEMREATNGKYPRFALWENVPGAFSSNKGEDFRSVLEELIKVSEPGAVMPEVPKKGWAYADSYVGDGWSIAYRVFDAQYWGVPQRRRRIYLVADFGGQCAREVLFKRQGLRGHLTESPPPRERVTVYVEVGSGATDREGTEEIVCMATQQGGAEIRKDDKAPTVTASAGMSGNNQPVIAYSAGFKAGQGVNARGIGWEDEQIPTLAAEAGGNSVPGVCIEKAKIYDARGNGNGATANTITGDHENRITDYSAVVVKPIPIHDQATRFSGKHGEKQDGKGNGFGIGQDGDAMNTLTGGDRHAVCYTETYQKVTGPLMANSHPGSYTGQDAYNDMLIAGVEHMPVVFDKEVYQSGENATGGHYISEGGPAPALRTTGHPPGICVEGADCRNGMLTGDLSATLQAKANGGFSYNCIHPVIIKEPTQHIVRRLTPTECARLQGFSDTWGHPEKKEGFTEEEYRFWLEVRNTHAAMNGKQVKEHTKAQMLTWYNKLHTDSAEYKMWGNGIALPTALYCMQGIAEVFDESN